MPPERRDATRPEEWLRRARSNLSRARADQKPPEVLYEDLCFDAQQAAEKSLKALLVHRQLAFPRTHAIADLLSLLDTGGVSIPEHLRESAILTGYAVEARYPGLSEDVTEEEHRRAVDLAERVLGWVESLVQTT